MTNQTKRNASPVSKVSYEAIFTRPGAIVSGSIVFGFSKRETVRIG